MATYTVTRASHAPARQKKLHARHLRHGYVEAASHRIKDWIVTFYTRPGRSNACFLDLADAGFIGVAGSLIYDGATGEEAARKLHDAFDGKSVDWSKTNGGYTVILKKFDRLFVFADRLGLNKIYMDTGGNCLSNSFISVLDQLEKSTPDPVGSHQYAWLTVIHGERTFISEIKPAAPNSLIEAGEKFEVRQLALPINRTLGDWPLNFEESAEFYNERLRKIFSVLAGKFDGQINCSLSGGYDSRLVFSLLLDAGVKPKLYVYGGPADPDVIVAKHLAAIAGQEIEWVNKSIEPLPSAEEWPERLDEICFGLDGWTNEGLPTDGYSDLKTRLSRSEGDQVLLLGTAGEVFRNFFYLPDKTYNLRAFVRAIYFRFSPEACGPDFRPEEYHSAFVDDISRVVGATSDRMDRRQIEMIYPLLRARYFFGRDMVINQRFGWSFSPFLEPAVFEGAHNLPLKYKTLGAMERRMIERLNPELAACPSAYGHAVSEPTPLSSKLRYYMLDHYRPMWLRERSYQIQHRKPEALPPILQGGYLKAAIDPEYPFMRRLFNISRVFDASAMNRITTMEYVLQKANGA